MTGGDFKTGGARQSKYALQVKGSLQSSIQELNTWSELYDVSLVMTRRSENWIDQKLAVESIETDGETVLTAKSLRPQSIVAHLEDCKFDTTFHINNQFTLHLEKRRDRSGREINVYQKWLSREEIGSGTFGRIWLQEGQSGRDGPQKKAKLRALKEVERWHVKKYNIDYMKELETLARFSQTKVTCSVVPLLRWNRVDLFPIAVPTPGFLCRVPWMVRKQ